MLVFIFKFSCSLAIFLVFYKLFLENQRNHIFKRFFLLLAVVCALGFPLITFTTYIEAPTISTSGFQSLEKLKINEEISVSEVPFDYLSFSLQAIYAVGLLFFAIKFGVNLFQLIKKIRWNPKQKKGQITNVLLEEDVLPHTFLRYIFYNKQKFEETKIPEEVLWHEQTHARQRHTIDVLFIELLQILMWFNPLVFLTKSAIKLNHEFLADQGVLDKGVTLNTYQKIVLAFSTDDIRPELVNTFNYSFIKKRFTIMKKQSTKQGRAFRSLLVLPLLSITLFSFSNRDIEIKAADEDPLLVKEVLQVQNDVSTIEEYNRLAKHYNAYPEYDFVTKVKDMWRIRHLYEALSETDKANAEPYPKSTTSLAITITNDGHYLTEANTEITIASIEALFKQLMPEELSNAYVFSREFDTGKYVKLRGAMNRSKLPPNDIYIHLISQEFVPGKVINANVSEQSKTFGKEGVKFVTAALINPKLKPYVEPLHEMFKKYGIHVDYD